jgi:GDP-L-fucose synthase
MNAEPIFALHGKRVWVAGDRGLVGSGLVRRLKSEDCLVLSAPRDKVDLRDPDQTFTWMAENRPQVIFLAAAKVGGILANSTRPATFLYDNMMIEANVIESARMIEAEKLMFLGSSCIYPREATQPITEDALLSGPLEPTNQWYAIAKIAGLKLCQAYRRQYGVDYISVMPTNLYGPGDNFDLNSSHVMPALIAKAHAAKQNGSRSLEVWGTGSPLREMLHVDDAADAMVHVMKHYSGEDPVNIGSGDDLSIADMARLVCEVVGFTGEIRFDTSKPDGTPRKVLDIGQLRRLGWTPKIDLRDGIRSAYLWYLANYGQQRVSSPALV